MRDVKVRGRPRVGERIDTVGIDWGPKGLILIHREGDFGIYKTPGHMAWTSSLSPWSWYPTRYGILQLLVGEEEDCWGKVDLLPDTEMAPGHSWRAAIKDLKYEVGKLAAGDADVLEYHGIKRGRNV